MQKHIRHMGRSGKLQSSIGKIRRSAQVAVDRAVYSHRPCLETLESRTLFNAGSLDSTFNGGGVLINPTAAFAVSAAVAAQPDGQSITLAVSQSGSGNATILVGRLHADSTLDLTFGGGGYTAVPTAQRFENLAAPDALIVQPNGSILVAVGDVLARLTSTGSLDTTFAGGSGVKTLAVNETGVALQSDGKILVAGNLPGPLANPVVYRLNANGTTDTTYGASGAAVISSSTLKVGDAGGIALDSAGRAVVSMAGQNQYFVARLSTAGKLDTTFGKGGFAGDGGQDNDADGFSRVAIAPNGTIYLGANYDQGDGDEAVVSAFSSAGKLVAGVPQTGPTFFGGITSMTVDVNNRLLASGFEFYTSSDVPNSNGFNTDVFVDRFLPPGAALAPLQLDPAYGEQGQAYINYSQPDPQTGFTDHTNGEFGDIGYSIALQSDGKLLVAGVTNESTPAPATDEFTFDRLNGDSISGSVYNDLNRDGVHESNEPGVAGVRVYMDPNYNHAWNSATEPGVLTDANGNFVFTNPPADPEILRIILPSGAQQTYPANGAGEYVGTSTFAAGLVFNFDTPGVIVPASVSGTVFNDIDSDGSNDDGGSGVGGVQVYLDVKHTGTFAAGDPNTTTDGSGNFTISGVAPGSYVLRETVPPGDEQSNPPGDANVDPPGDNGGISITLAQGQALTDADFEMIVPKFPTDGQITGTVFNDSNHDGIQDDGETGIPNVTVYQDPNYNHKLDGNEQSAVTDGIGDYVFNVPPADPEIIRVILPGGAQQSFPANGIGQYVGKNTGANHDNVNFGIYTPTTLKTATIFGTLASKNAYPFSLGGIAVYVDLKNTGSYAAGDPESNTDFTGNYGIANIPPGTYHVRALLPAGDTLATPLTSVTLVAGQTQTNVNVYVTTAPASANGFLAGVVYKDTFTDSTGVAGVTVYMDSNYNHKIDPGEQIAVTNAVGDYYFTNPPADPEILRIVLPSGTQQIYPDNGAGEYVGKLDGNNVSNLNFGISVKPN